ncbi:MAG: peptidase M15, partial [Thiothrix lacustris]
MLNDIFMMGKIVGNDIYVAITAIDALSVHHKEIFERYFYDLNENIKLKTNVLRINSYNEDISFLEYEELSEHAFPRLFSSIRAGNDLLRPRKTDYKLSNNPPILHRKELLLPPDHPDIPKFAALTKQLEDAGLFKDSRKIGYKKQWEERLRNAGYKVVDHKLVKLDGSEIAPPETIEKTSNVERHRTALTRYALSKPMQLLAKHDFLEGKHTIFDYGCGKGSDVDILRQNNLTANGWDPHFCPDNPKHTADVVNLGFVINVIEDKDERLAAVLGAYQLCTQFLCAAVMLGEQSTERGRLFRDGVLTSRNTFQRYYSQEEFREYLRRVLDEDPVAVGPGVFFVFKDKDAEQAFLERRYRNRSTANRLISQIPKQPKAPKATRPTKTEKEQAFYQQHADVLDALWLCWLELGRPPQEDEFPQVAAVKDLFGTWQRGLNFLQRFHGTETLKFAFESRREDLTVYFAMRRFDQQRVYRHLPESLKRDVKAFFTSYPLAQTDGERLLFSAGNPALIRQMCQQAATDGYGYLDAEGSLTFHTSQVVSLPPILRVYIGCATQVFGDVTSADLLKIHAESGKLSLMKYDDFEGLALPRLLERIKISLVNQRFEYYKYGETYAPTYLYLKA